MKYMISLRCYNLVKLLVAPFVLLLLLCGCKQETVTYYEDGSLRSKCTINDDGDSIGNYTLFSRAGELWLSGEFDSEGERTGIWIDLYSDEYTRVESRYLDGHKHGIETAYSIRYLDQEDKIKYSGSYEKGVKQGKWEYYVDGQLVFSEYYENGTKVKVEDLRGVGN